MRAPKQVGKRARRPGIGLGAAVWLCAALSRGAGTTAPATSPSRAPVPAVAAPHVVVMADGTLLASRTRPVMALGQVSFIAASGQLVTLPASAVDVTATRERLGPARRPPLWDIGALERARAATRVQVVAAPVAEPEEAMAWDESAGLPPVPIGAGEQALLLQAEIERLQKALAAQPPDTREATALILRQREVQAELSRLVDAPKGK